MAETVWSAWYDAVAPDVPGAPPTLIAYAVKRAAIEFCDRSCAWRRQLASISTVANQGDYAFAVIDGGSDSDVMVVKVLEARWLGEELTPARPDELKAEYAPVDWRGVLGTPQFFTQEEPNEIRIVPAPTSIVASGINGIWVAVRPVDDALGINIAFAAENYEAIAEGAKRRLMESPGKPYTDAKGAALYGGKFDTAIGDAAFRAFRGMKGRARTRTSFT